MKSLSEIVLKSVELLEAEGRLLRAKTIAAGSAIVSTLIGGLFLLVGSIVAGYAAYTHLSKFCGETFAALAVAVAFVLIGIMLICHGNSKR